MDYFADKFEWLKNSSNDQSQRCLVEEFFEKEARKPIYLRSKFCMISCPCKLCSPTLF